MKHITDFIKTRADGKLIPPNMDTKEMISLGWEPSKVIALSWKFKGHQIQIDAPGGIHAMVVEGDNYICGIYIPFKNRQNSALVIISPDGSVVADFDNVIIFSGKSYAGRYVWFEPATNPSKDVFGVIFQTDEQIYFRCDVDARAGSLITIVKIR